MAQILLRWICLFRFLSYPWVCGGSCTSLTTSIQPLFPREANQIIGTAQHSCVTHSSCSQGGDLVMGISRERASCTHQKGTLQKQRSLTATHKGTCHGSSWNPNKCLTLRSGQSMALRKPPPHFSSKKEKVNCISWKPPEIVTRFLNRQGSPHATFDTLK